jgi:hypothetical protein
LGRWRRSSEELAEKMAISPSSVLSRKENGGGVEEDAKVR